MLQDGVLVGLPGGGVGGCDGVDDALRLFMANFCQYVSVIHLCIGLWEPKYVGSNQLHCADGFVHYCELYARSSNRV